MRKEKQMVKRGNMLKGSYTRYQKKEIRELRSKLSEGAKARVLEQINARMFLYPEDCTLARFAKKVLNG